MGLPTSASTSLRRNRMLPWAALTVVYVVWGSTYLAIRVGVETVPPLVLAAVRYLVAGAVLYPLAVRSGTPSQRAGDRPGRQQWWAAAVVGVLLLAVGNGGVSLGEQTVPSGLASLFVATVPLWMIGADRVVNGHAVGWRSTLALIIGLLGVSILAHPTGNAHAAAELTVLIAAASWGFGSVLSRRLRLPARPLLGSAMEMLAGGAVLLVAAAASGEFGRLHLAHISAGSVVALIYLIGPGSLLALSAYVVALQRLPTSTVATYAYVNPVIAVALGAVLLDEPVSGTTLVGAGVILAAVVLTVTAQRRR